MGKRGRRPVLDETKRAVLLGILAVGCSRRTAASYVGCAVSTIQNTADRDPEFAERLQQAECQSEIAHLKSIQQAARKEQHWRAAAWTLERKNPEDFARRGPDVITAEEVKDVLAELARIVIDEVPVARYRKSILRRFDALLAGLGRLAQTEKGHDED